MAKLVKTRVAFILSHPFHYTVYKSLIAKLPNCLAVIEKRVDTPFDFSADFLSKLPCKYIVLEDTEIKVLDNICDVIVCMTPKHLQSDFRQSKTVAMQYGMAKEHYNYGLWRCLADVNLMYGPYSHNMVKGYCVSVPVGNTRFDDFNAEISTGGGLLYMPTYGDLSSLAVFTKALRHFPVNLQVKVKLHHASEFTDAPLIAKLKQFPKLILLDGYQDAATEIAKADMVLSDYSGAIFDAVYLNKPVAFLQPAINQSVVRTTERSIEIARAEEFGCVLRSADDLASFAKAIARDGYPERQQVDRAEFFSNHGNAASAAVAAIEDMLEGRLNQSVAHISIKSTYLKLAVRNKQTGFRAKILKSGKKIKYSALALKLRLFGSSN